MTWKLVNATTGEEVKHLDTVIDFRGDKAYVRQSLGIPPHKPGSTGRIHTSTGEYYPSVFGCKWVTKTADEYHLIREYLDLILEPDPYFRGNNSHWVLGTLFRDYGREKICSDLDEYFVEMGNNGQLDPHNKWRNS